MIKRVGIGFAAALWFVFAFWAVYRLTFPSAAVAERLAWEAQERGGVSLTMASSHPWWAGLGGTEVKLGSIDRRTKAVTPMLEADGVRARIGLFGLLTGSARITGDLTMGDGGIDFYVDAAQGDKDVEIRSAEIEAIGFPISAFPPVQGMSLVGKGGFDLSVELEAPEGMNKADGHVKLGGQNVIIEDVAGTGGMLATFGVMPMVLDEVDIDLQFVSGKGRMEAGRIASTLADVDIAGTVTLAKRLDRAKCDLTVEIRPKEDMPAQVLSLMKAAKQPGESYKYKMSGVCSRASFTPVRVGGGAAAARARPTRRRPNNNGAANNPVAGGKPTRPTADLGEPVRASRPPAIAGGVAVPPPSDAEPEEIEDEEILEDEELLEEELEVGDDEAPADY
ncbi:MAG: type II secretion system protein GspN [Deltaproteobacteria bacterium]|nr:MAG: type II secretion system protein GspN [Deltaproteobacteria bacterium]